MASEYTWGRIGGSGAGSEGDGRSRELERRAEALRTALERNRDVDAWTLTSTVTVEHQIYLAGTETEAVRYNERQGLSASLHVRTVDTMGTASVRVEPGEEALLDQKVQGAVAVARQSESRPYPLPDPVALPSVETVDATIAREPESALLDLRATTLESVGGQRNVRLASAEFFLERDETVFETSTGLVSAKPGTRVTAELVLIGDDGRGNESEVQDLRRRRRVRDLELASTLSRLAEEARDGTRAVDTPSYEGPVVLPADTLHSYFRPITSQSSYETAFDRRALWEIGDWIGGDSPRGDALNLSGDATLPYGTETSPCDSYGVRSRRTTVVDGGRFIQRWGSLPHCHYLGEPPTGSFGNLVIEGGSRSSAQLMQGSEVLEVRRFSWLNPSSTTGDYTSEIRFGYLHRDGRSIPVRGGSLIGNVFDSTADCWMDRQQVFIGRALVPAAVRFNVLRVAGSHGA